MIERDVVISAAALAHCVPGAELLLKRTDGGRLTVARHSRADLSPCTFRHLVAQRPCPIATQVDTWLGGIVPGGALDHVVAGVYRSRYRRGERWFVASLNPSRVRTLFSNLDCDVQVADETTVTLTADLELGVVVVKLEVESGFSKEEIDGLALCAYANYLAEFAVSQSIHPSTDQISKRKE